MEEIQIFPKFEHFPKENKLKVNKLSFRVHTQGPDSYTKNRNIERLRSQTNLNGLDEMVKQSKRNNTAKRSIKRENLSERKNTGKLQNFIPISSFPNTIKFCKNKCSGYTKRDRRLRQNMKSISSLFRDSSKVSRRKQQIQANIQNISKSLRRSFPIWQLGYKSTDQDLLTERNQYINILAYQQFQIGSR